MEIIHETLHWPKRLKGTEIKRDKVRSEINVVALVLSSHCRCSEMESRLTSIVFDLFLRSSSNGYKVQLREQGARHDLVDAVFALEGQDDLLLVVRRVEALGKFLDTEDGKNLLAGYKRATNILRIEEKRANTEYKGAPEDGLYRQAEEWELVKAIDTAAAEATSAVAREDFPPP